MMSQHILGWKTSPQPHRDDQICTFGEGRQHLGAQHTWMGHPKSHPGNLHTNQQLLLQISCPPHQPGVKSEFKYVGYFLFHRVNISLGATNGSFKHRGCSERRELMLQGRSKYFPGRLTQIINGGSLNPLQEGWNWRNLERWINGQRCDAASQIINNWE